MSKRRPSDLQEAHASDLQSGEPKPYQPPAWTPETEQDHNLIQQFGFESSDEKKRAVVLSNGHFFNGHPVESGTVLELTAGEIAQHRAQGYQIGPVKDDDKREVYDHTVPWVNPDHDEGEAVDE